MATKEKTGFLPNKDYELPDSSSFMKFEPGKNKFRILSHLVTGWVYWTEDNKPIRSREEPTATPGAKKDKSGKVSVDHFWNVVVYNYKNEKIQTLEIRQKGVQKYILGLVNDEDWGDPQGYDIVVTKEGEGLTTKYTVAANPHKEMPAEVLEAYANCGIDLDAIFSLDEQ